MRLTNQDLLDFQQFNDEDFAQYFREHADAKEKLSDFFSLAEDDHKSNQLAYYAPMNDMAAPVHQSRAREIAIVGGNRSGKTETALVELIIRATGHIPMALMATYPKDKLAPPIRGRVVCNSLTDTLEPVIKPKLRWDQWNGPSEPGVGIGHWGWVPRRCLWGGEWEKAYLEKYRTLKLTVDTHWVGRHGAINSITGISSIQFLCLAPEIPVLRPDGTWTPLRDLSIGEYVQTRFGSRLVTAIYRYETAPRTRIHCWSGHELVATPNHLHLTAARGWQPTSALDVGDVLMSMPIDPDKWDAPEDDWRLGWTAIMIGDGCLREKQASFSATHPSRVLSRLPPLPPGCRIHTMGDGKTHKVTLIGRRRDNPLVQSLKHDRLWGLYSHQRFIPSWVFRQPREQIELFMRYLWATDGTGAWGQCANSYQSNYTTTSYQLAQDVKHLLWRLGYQASMTQNKFLGLPSVYRGQIIVHRHPIFQVRTSWKSPTRPGKIRLLEPLPNGPMMCLTVEGSHEFIADGLCTGNSYDQDLSAFSGTSLHCVVHDELPPSDIYRENRMRTLDTKGTIITAFTPPDETGGQRADVAWFYDEVYERGLHGPSKDPAIDTFVLWTERNKALTNIDLELITRTLTEEQKQARLYGQFLHLSGVVYPLFSDYPSTWCFKCQKKSTGGSTQCLTCGGTDVTVFCHVIEPFEIPKEWPIVFVIDPHPRKKDAMGWFAVTPSDHVILIGEHEGEGDAGDVARQILDWERVRHISPAQRLMDPNIATETNDRLERGWNLRMAYDRVGIRCDLANDSIPLGIQNVNELLKPNPMLRAPRFQCFSICRRFRFGMRHWAWEEWSRQSSDKEPKEVVRDRHKDFPDLLRYMANSGPEFKKYTRLQWQDHLRGVPHGGY